MDRRQLEADLRAVQEAAGARFAAVLLPARERYRATVGVAEADLDRAQARGRKLSPDEGERLVLQARAALEAAQAAAGRAYAEAVQPAQAEHAAAIRGSQARFERLEALALEEEYEARRRRGGGP